MNSNKSRQKVSFTFFLFFYFFTFYNILIIERVLAKIKIQTSKIQDLFLLLVLTDYIALLKFLVCMEIDFPI